MKLKSIAILIIILVLSYNEIVAQNYLNGYQYDLNTDTFTKFKYTRSFSESDNEYTTTYNVYHPTKGYHAITVKAIHRVSEKKVVVNVRFATGGLLSEICTEETRYDIPSLEPFGHRGFIAEFGGSRVPNQLMVKFISKKYENVKVMHINGSIPSDNEYIFYVLDEN